MGLGGVNDFFWTSPAARRSKDICCLTGRGRGVETRNLPRVSFPGEGVRSSVHGTTAMRHKRNLAGRRQERSEMPHFCIVHSFTASMVDLLIPQASSTRTECAGARVAPGGVQPPPSTVLAGASCRHELFAR